MSEERPPVESEVIDEREIQPMGEGHVDETEGNLFLNLTDPTGANGPSYERDQAYHGQDRHPGGSTDPGDSRSHADTYHPALDPEDPMPKPVSAEVLEAETPSPHKSK